MPGRDREMAERLYDGLEAAGAFARPCSACGHQDWSALDRPFELREYATWTPAETDPPGWGPARAVAPVAVAQCDHCGHLVLFNAVKIGLFGRGGGPDNG